MASRVYMHIGLPKTGTSYLQSLVAANYAELRRQGVLVPGSLSDHHRACLEVRDVVDSRENLDPELFHGTWRRLLKQIEAWPGPALITDEMFAGASTRHVGRIVRDLQPAEVHVVLTVRDLVRAFPAAWQQSVKGGKAWRFTDYIDSIREGQRETGWFQKAQFPERVLARWSKHVPSHRIHVVTLPPRGSSHDLLWKRFCEPLDLEPGAFVMSDVRANESLGVVEAELLRRINEHLVPRLETTQVAAWVRNLLGNDVLARRTGKQSFAVPEDRRPWVRESSRRGLERIERGGYDIVGSLDDLVPGDVAPGAPHPDEVSDEQLVAAATETIAELVVRLRDATAASRKARRRLRRLRGRVPARVRQATTQRLRAVVRRARRRLS
jgi:hypothetical protein